MKSLGHITKKEELENLLLTGRPEMKSNRRVTENNLYNKLVYMIDRTGNGRYSKIITYLELQRKGSRGEK